MPPSQPAATVSRALQIILSIIRMYRGRQPGSGENRTNGTHSSLTLAEYVLAEDIR
jgi:hypothetical protein